MQTVVGLAGDRLVATHYGLYQTIAGLSIAAGTALTGRAFDIARDHRQPALAWIALAGIGLASTYGLHRLACSAPATSTQDIEPMVELEPQSVGR